MNVKPSLPPFPCPTFGDWRCPFRVQGCVKTCASKGAQNCFLACPPSTVTASVVLILFKGFETKFLRASSTVSRQDSFAPACRNCANCGSEAHLQCSRWNRQHVPDASETGKGETSAALSQLKATDRSDNKPARKQPEQKRHNLDTETWQNDALVGHQAPIPCKRDIRCRDV